MSKLLPWRGVRLATFAVGVDPDSEPHRVAIPTGWGEEAARGLVGLACDPAPAGWGKLRLPDAAEAWIAPIDAAARAGGSGSGLGERLHAMLLLRQGCPDRPVWRGEPGPRGFVLHVAAFADGGAGFDEACFDAALDAAASALAACGPAATQAAIRLAGLDGMLAALGLPYDSDEARALGVRLVRRARLRLRAAPVPIALVAGEAGSAEALLGVETAGYAPAFAPVGSDGRLTTASEARLAHLRLSPERALASLLEGANPLPTASLAAHTAMHDALVPLLDAAPARPGGPAPRLAVADVAPRRRALPARSKGFTQKVAIGGHRLFLRTAEYADGALGEVSITLGQREGTLGRGLADAVGTAISIALQHGVPLDAFVEAFAHGRFGPAGAVEGDPSIAEASSPLDYAMRALAEAYGGRHIPDPRPADPVEGDETRLLPLGLPEPVAPPAARQRSLRLVSTS